MNKWKTYPKICASQYGGHVWGYPFSDRLLSRCNNCGFVIRYPDEVRVSCQEFKNLKVMDEALE